MKPELLAPLYDDETQVDGTLLDELLALFEKIAGEAAKEDFRTILSYAVMRAIEIELMSSPEMIDIALNPGIYLGSERRLIANSLVARLGEAPPSLVAHYRSLVLSGAAGASRKQSTEPYVEAVFRKHREANSQLRCVICGYHFVANDLGPFRREVAQSLGLELATEKLSRRLRDPWKPSEKTMLDLDHWIPEAGLGPTAAANLRVMCRFCNTNKAISRWPSELASVNVSSSLLTVGDTESGVRGSTAANAATFFAIANGRLCSICSESPLTVELTALVTDRGRRPARPWSIKAVCYRCYEPETGSLD